MPIGFETSLKDWFEMDRIQEKQMRDWEKNRIIKRCRECRQPYSYEKGGLDPKECQRCRGAEGDLVL